MRLVVSLVCVVLLAGAMPAMAGLFSSCDGSKAPMPTWVSKPDYTLPGYYVGVGSAEKKGKTKDEQTRVSEENAKSHLVQGIEVLIRAENEQSTQVSETGVQSALQNKVIVQAEEVLRDLQVKSRWMDGDNCQLYTLMVVSQESVARARREKIMKNRLEKFRELLAEGADRDKNSDINLRRKYLDNAQALLMDTDFSVLPEELGKDAYIKQLNDVVALFNKESSQVKGRTALVALNQDNALQASVIGNMLDMFRATHDAADRLMASCDTPDDCVVKATERGFSRLILFRANTQTGTSAMGALKGTLTVSKTEYDIESRKILKGPDTASAQVIGWSNEELDWNAAAEKAMRDLK